jgi:hypothetical protein
MTSSIKNVFIVNKNPSVIKAATFLEALDNLCVCLYQLLEVTFPASLVAPSFFSKPTVQCLHISLCLCFLPFIYRDVCDYIGSTWIIQDNLPTSKSLICYIIQNPFDMQININSQDLKISIWTSWEASKFCFHK